MQTIYADVFFFINMFVDFLLLLCVKRIIHSNIKNYRLIISSIIGAVFSFTAFIPFNQFPVNLLINIFSLIILSLICFGFKNKTQFIKNTSILLVVSFLFSGAMLYLYSAFRPDGMVVINNVVYFNISPLLLIILSFIIYGILYIFKKIFKNHSRSELLHKVSFVYQNKEYVFKCKTDSGCNVKEPFSGASVIVVENDGINIDDKKMRIIPFNSLGGNGILYGFKAEAVYIDDHKINQEVYIGLCKDIFKSEIKGLIPENIIEE